MNRTIIVGMADLNICKDADRLSTLGLGSCVGVTLYCPITHIAGMAHIMLPDSSTYRPGEVFNEAKFANTAVAALLKRMLAAGAHRNAMIAKMAGGANMFGSATSDTIKIGARNAAAVRMLLTAMYIPLRADDTGGNYGRTITLFAESGELLVKTIGHGEKTL